MVVGPTAWWALAGGALLLSVLAALADHRRNRRRDLDRPGWVPWSLVQILSAMVALVAAALALKA